MDLTLKGRTALVTGAASGIGLASVRQFLAEGCNVVMWDRDPAVTSVAEKLTVELSQNDSGEILPAVVGRQVDIVDRQQVEAATNAIQQVNSVQHVVHCAATGSGKFGFPFTNLQPRDWDHTLNVNIKGMVHLAHALTPVLRAQKFGTFVFIASIAGQIGSPTDPPYSASKAANINFAQCMAKDLAKDNIRVNSVCPGMVQTPLNRSVWQAWHDRTEPSQRLTYELWAKQKIESLVPLGRWQQCEDIADMIVFLSSDRSKEVTGQTINVDGGQVMHW